MYTRNQIEEMLCMSESKIKYIIERLGILPVKVGKYNLHYYDKEQIELIKENNPKYYEKDYILLPSKINFGY